MKTKCSVIANPKRKETFLRDLRAGDAFLYRGNYYIKGQAQKYRNTNHWKHKKTGKTFYSMYEGNREDYDFIFSWIEESAYCFIFTIESGKLDASMSVLSANNIVQRTTLTITSA